MRPSSAALSAKARVAALIAFAQACLAAFTSAPAQTSDQGARFQSADRPALEGLLGERGGYASVDFTVLSAVDAERYRKIFELQDNGRWSAADAEIRALESDLLMGHVKYQRYMHPTAYRSTYSELKNWMAHYADHPDAQKIYRLALKRRPSNYRRPDPPEKRAWRGDGGGDDHPAFAALGQSASERRRVRAAEAYVRRLLHRERPTEALNYVNSARVRSQLADIQYDRIRSWIAASYFYEMVDGKAYRLAAEVADRSGETAPVSYWAAGLSAWRMGDTAAAARHFSAGAETPHQGAALQAAQAYWAARAALAVGEPERVTPMLEIAADAPLTFYGQLALKQLGRPFDIDWNAPRLTQADFNALIAKNRRVARAAALAQVGQRNLAEIELRRAHHTASAEDDGAVLALARALQLPAAELEVALAGQGAPYEAGLYPVPAYQPSDGFELDRALLFAFMRQESKFIVNAKSRAGARGLMQLMPRTASYITKDRSLYRGGRDKLYEPEFNMSLGQRYIKYLMQHKESGANLFKVAVAYNGGPGNLRRWSREMPVRDDPLLFIESIPNYESRTYVERVLTNLWIYRARFGEPTPSLDAVAAGAWPVYESVETPASRAVAVRVP